ncbi:MAG TPA: HD-GYP domain-containing protein [Dissulfurispiraceae bacterium]|nr:HD-GYP domain-containing protein [Dissulfurispiraceae bacterium]
MIKKIKSKDLKPGMHVIIPSSWLNHPFAKGRFNIRSEDQIKKIIESGFDEVKIDTDQEIVIAAIEPQVSGYKEIAPPSKWNPATLVPPVLREAIHDKHLAAEKKASVVYESSVELMGRLLEDPKAENIGAAKECISDIVDMVLSQDDTSYHLLRITSHDFYTYTHSVNVGVFSILLAKSLFRGNDAHNMHELGAGFFLHDLGKVQIEAAIINKPGKLTDDEMKQMKAHPYQGYKLLRETKQLSEECGIIALQHHEREDGTGYPRGLRGNEIHNYGRICCIADVYDALTAERSYKAKLSSFEALNMMKNQMLHFFPKSMFEKFVLLFTDSQPKCL